MPSKNSAKRGVSFLRFLVPAFFIAGFFVFSHSARAAAPLDSNDLAVWHFDEASGNSAADASGNQLNLSWSYNPYGNGRPAPERAMGRWDLGVHFNQSEEQYSARSYAAIDFPDGLTVGAWIKTDLDSPELSRFFWLGNTTDYAGIPANCFMLSVKDGVAYLDFKTNNQWSAPLSSAMAVNDDRWHFVAARFDVPNGKMAIFVDGQKEAESALTVPVPVLESVVIGRREDYWASGGTNFFGTVDDVWLRKQSLTDEEIGAAYLSGRPYKEEIVSPPDEPARLLAHYGFDGPSGTVAEDSSDNKYDLHWAFNPWGNGEGSSRSVLGKFGQAVSFKKVEDLFYKSFSPAISFSGGVTIGVWGKTAAASEASAMLVWLGNTFNHAGDPASFFSLSEYQGRARLDLRTADGFYFNLASDKKINDGQWHFYTMVLDGRPYQRTWKFFIDGSLQSEAPLPADVPPAEVLKVGYRNDYYAGSGRNFDGDIDDLFILSSVISDEKVKELYDRNEPYSDPAPKRNPVIIVPGIIASYLNNAMTGEEIWPNFGDTIIQCINSCQGDLCKKACIRNCGKGMNNILCSLSDNFLDQLILKEDGAQAENNPVIRPTDIFRNITDLDFFAGLIQELKNNGYEENKDLFVFPYDWRLNIDWVADNNPTPFSLTQTLKQKISEAKTKNGSEKVDIIAHSLGGLVVKDYIQKNGTSSINKFVDIATPHLGSPLAFKILNYGDNLDICIGGGRNKLCFLNVEESKEMSQNMPSVYQLLPSRKYFASTIFDPFSTGNYIYDIVGGDQNVGVLSPLDYSQSIDFLATHEDEKEKTRNQFLLGYFGVNTVNINDELHSRVDNLPNYDKYYNIIGCGQDTFAGIKKWDKGYKVLPPIDGDNTVPLKSASAFANVNHRYYARAKHSLIPSVDGVRQLVVSILQDKENDFNFSAYQGLKQDASACTINGAQIGALSPVELHAYDENGNHTGPLENGGFEESIPGSSYDVFGKDQYIFLPAGHSYHIVNQATSSGELGITIDEIKNSQPVKSVYFDSIALKSASTTVVYDITDNQADYQATIDSDGNGTANKVIAPSSVLTGEQLDDLAVPQTSVSISGQIGNNGYYVSDVQIELIATDDNSGVLKTEYSLDGGQIWQSYQGKIILSNSGDNKVIYRSVDKAGNQEADKTVIVKTDKVKPIISVLLPQESQEVLHSDKLNVTYLAADDFSSIATDTAEIYLDGQVVDSGSMDLFKQNLGAHKIKITIHDLAGNKAEQTVNFFIVTDVDGTIADINRAYDEKMIVKVEAKKDLVGALAEIKNFQEKYGQRINKEKVMRDKALAQCLKHKDQAWCENKIGARLDRFEYQLNKINQAVIRLKYNLVMAKLDLYSRLKWINPAGYTIIKEDIKYLINKI